MSKDMKSIMENWRVYEGYSRMTLDEAKEARREDRMRNPKYITEVLGVEIPLNESYPYSSELSEKILNEQLFLEHWWNVMMEGSAMDWLKRKAAQGKEKVVGWAKGATDWFGGKIETIKRFPDTAKMLFMAVTDEDKIGPFEKALSEKGQVFIDRIKQFVNFVIEKGGFGVAIFKKWAEGIKATLERLLSAVSGAAAPWLKVLGLVSLSVGVAYLWAKVGNYAKETLGCTDAPTDSGHGGKMTKGGLVSDVAVTCGKSIANKFIKDKTAELTKKAGMVLAKGAASVATMGFSTYWGWIAKAVGGAWFLVDTLEPVLAQFKAGGGFEKADAAAGAAGAGNRPSEPVLSESEAEMIGRIVREEYAMVTRRRTG